ncbi:MAG: flavin prenyltransferase UbiX [Pseudomonadota bacterium]
MNHETKTVALAVTGASGIQYAMRLLECLLQHDAKVYLMFSKAAQIVAGMETDWNLPARTADIQEELCKRHSVTGDQLKVFGESQWTAPVASGSGVPDAMVVCPCTTGTLAAIANGSCDCLIERAADVVIKESRKLIVMPREMPFSPIHLENMLKLARIGVTILPPNPGFYNKPETVDDLIDFVVARVLDQLKIEQSLMPVWGADE